jgi:hypothetical protein
MAAQKRRVSYVIFGKSVLNVAVGLLLGAVGGAIVGAAATRISLIVFASITAQRRRLPRRGQIVSETYYWDSHSS